MPLDTAHTPQFLHKTALAPHEYRKNFRQIDCDALALVRSAEATRVTGLMSKIYLGLLGADHRFFEREGVLHFTGEVRQGHTVTAWEMMVEVMGVANNTAAKAIKWLHEKRIIGYHANKNGVGIRIFLNRAANSVGHRGPAEAAKAAPPAAPKPIAPEKNLAVARTPKGEAGTTFLVAPFKDNCLRETLDQERDPAPVTATCETAQLPAAPGAEVSPLPENTVPDTPAAPLAQADDHAAVVAASATPPVSEAAAVSLLAAQILALQSALGHLQQNVEANNQAAARHLSAALARLKHELLHNAHQTAGHAAADAVRREYERTRDWFEQRALPKAVRVAQRESFDLLRQAGWLQDREAQRKAGLQVGRQATSEEAPPAAAHAQSEADIRALAEICVTLHQTQGQDLNAVLGHLCAYDGSPLLPGDLLQIRDLAQAIEEGREVMSNPLLLAPGVAPRGAMAQS